MSRTGMFVALLTMACLSAELRAQVMAYPYMSGGGSRSGFRSTGVGYNRGYNNVTPYYGSTMTPTYGTTTLYYGSTMTPTYYGSTMTPTYGTVTPTYYGSTMTPTYSTVMPSTGSIVIGSSTPTYGTFMPGTVIGSTGIPMTTTPTYRTMPIYGNVMTNPTMSGYTPVMNPTTSGGRFGRIGRGSRVVTPPMAMTPGNGGYYYVR